MPADPVRRDVLQERRWDHQVPASRRRGRLTEPGCLGASSPTESRTCGGRDFPDGRPEQLTFGPTEEIHPRHGARRAINRDVGGPAAK